MLDFMIEGMDFRCGHDGCGRQEQSNVGEVPPGWYCEQTAPGQYRMRCWEHAGLPALFDSEPSNIQPQAAQAASAA